MEFVYHIFTFLLIYLTFDMNIIIQNFKMILYVTFIVRTLNIKSGLFLIINAIFNIQTFSIFEKYKNFKQ